MSLKKSLLLAAIVTAILLPKWSSATPFDPSLTGAQTATIGTGGGYDYASLDDACTSISVVNTGTLLAGDWTFTIETDLTEPNNVAVARLTNSHSIVFKPGVGKKPTITFTKSNDNSGPSGHWLIGITEKNPTGYNTMIASDGLTIDGSNSGGTTRDLTFKSYVTYTNAKFVVIIGGTSGNVVKNCNCLFLGTASGSQFGLGTVSRQHAGPTPPAGSYVPVNWIFKNNYIRTVNAGTGQGISQTNSGTLTAGTAQTGWLCEENEIDTRSRGIMLNQCGSGRFTNNTIRLFTATGVLGTGVYFLAANAAVQTITIDHNKIISLNSENIATAQGTRAIYFESNPGAASTANIYDNIICFPNVPDSVIGMRYDVRGITFDTAVSNFSTINIYNNSIWLSGTDQKIYPIETSSNYVRSCHAIGICPDAYAGTANIKNNNIYMGIPGSFCIYFTAGTKSFDYNNYFVTNGAFVGRFGTYAGGTSYSTLSTWKTGTSQDANSTNIDPTAPRGANTGVWSADCHFLGGTVGDFAGADLSALTLPDIGKDVDGESWASSWKIGADLSPNNYYVIVSSAHGNPLPLKGYNFIGNGVSKTAFVDQTVTETLKGCWTCSGYTGTGDIGSGATNSFTFTSTQASSLTWNWTGLTYYLSATSAQPQRGTVAVTGGTPSGTAGYYIAGSSPTITATALGSWTFDHWGGDLSGNTNPTTINMNNTKNVIAYFAPDSYSLTKKFMIKRSDNRPWLPNNADRTVRSAKFNPATGHITVLSRSIPTGAPSGTAAVLVKLDKEGNDLGYTALPNTIVTGGTFAANMHIVTSDGKIYFCNLTTAASTTAMKIYRMANENDSAPSVAFNSTVAALGANRVGDTIAITETGGVPTLYMGTNANAGPHFAVFTTADGGLTFAAPTVKTITGYTTAAPFRLGLSAYITGGNTRLWGDIGSQDAFSVDPNVASPALIDSLPSTNEPNQLNHALVQIGTMGSLGDLVTIGPGPIFNLLAQKKGYIYSAPAVGDKWKYAETSEVLQDVPGLLMPPNGGANGDGTGTIDYDYVGQLVLFNITNNTISVWPLTKDMKLASSSYAFGSRVCMAYGGSIADTTTNISNIGPASSLGSINVSQVSGSTDFTVQTQPATSLAPGASSSFTIRYTPTTVGAVSAVFAVNSDDPDEPAKQFTVTGTGLAPNIVGVPLTHDFGSHPIIGATPIDFSFAIQNQSTVPLTISGVTPGGSSDFALQVSPVGVVAANDATTMTIRYTPTTIGAVSGSFAVLSDDPDEPSKSFTVNAFGQAPNINIVTPGGADFGYILVSSPAPSKTLRIQNLGDADLTVSGISEAGSAEITFTPPTYPLVIAPSMSADVTVDFTPLSVSAYSKTLTVISNSPGETSVPTTFTGHGSNVTVNSSVDFGFVKVTQFGDAQLVIDNTNGSVSTTYTLAVGNAKYGPAASDSVEVDAGSSATLDVRYSPTAVMTDPSTFTLFSSDSGAPDLSGTFTGRGWSTIHGKKMVVTAAGATIQVEPDGVYTLSRVVIPPAALAGSVTITIQEPTDQHGKANAVEVIVSPNVTLSSPGQLVLEMKASDIGGPSSDWYRNQDIAIYSGGTFTQIATFATFTRASVGSVYTVSSPVTSIPGGSAILATILDPVKASVTDWRMFE